MQFLLIFSLLIASVSSAEIFRGPLSSSMGGTGRAASDAGESAFLNPALIPLLKNYEFDAYFRDGAADSGQHRNAYGVGAGDNTSDVLFPGAIHYLRLRDMGRANAGTSSELWHLAVGRAATKHFAFGASGYRLSSKVDGDREYVQWNYSLGLLFTFTPDIGMAYVLDHIAKPGSNVPWGLRQDLQQGVGFFASLGELMRVRLDLTRNEVNNPEHRLVYMLGFENVSGEFAIFRTGFRRDDERNQNYLTVGVGFNGPRLKLDYSFEKNLRGSSGALHGVDIRIPF